MRRTSTLNHTTTAVEMLAFPLPLPKMGELRVRGGKKRRKQKLEREKSERLASRTRLGCMFLHPTVPAYVVKVALPCWSTA